MGREILCSIPSKVGNIVLMDIPVLGFYGYIDGYFYMSIDIS